jgi:hypothetical protein
VPIAVFHCAGIMRCGVLGVQGPPCSSRRSVVGERGGPGRGSWGRRGIWRQGGRLWTRPGGPQLGAGSSQGAGPGRGASRDAARAAGGRESDRRERGEHGAASRAGRERRPVESDRQLSAERRKRSEGAGIPANPQGGELAQPCLPAPMNRPQEAGDCSRRRRRRGPAVWAAAAASERPIGGRASAGGGERSESEARRASQPGRGGDAGAAAAAASRSGRGEPGRRAGQEGPRARSGATIGGGSGHDRASREARAGPLASGGGRERVRSVGIFVHGDLVALFIVGNLVWILGSGARKLGQVMGWVAFAARGAARVVGVAWWHRGLGHAVLARYGLLL